MLIIYYVHIYMEIRTGNGRAMQHSILLIPKSHGPATLLDHNCMPARSATPHTLVYC